MVDYVQKTGDTMTGNLAIDSLDTNYGLVAFTKGGVARWNVGISNSSDAEWFLHSFKDDGNFNEAVFSVDRATGEVTHKGGLLRPADWFDNDVRNHGADPTGTALSDAAFTAAIADGRPIRVPKGTYKLTSGFNFGDSLLILERGTLMKDQNGNTLWGAIGTYGTGAAFDIVSNADRATIRTEGFGFKSDHSSSTQT